MILCGEHAVVYHRPAIAVPLSQIRARAEVLPSRTGAGLQICARDLGTCYGLSAAPPNDPLAVAALEVLRRLSVPEPDATLTIRSDIPVASGLGSGAAVAVAEIRALTRALGCELAPATVSALTYEVERIHHGTPSGIDNTVIAFEQPVFYESGRPIEPLRVRQSLELIVADSGMPSSTREAVKHVRSLWNHDREQYDGIFDSIAAIVEETRTVLQVGDVVTLGRLMAQNHALLQRLQISTPQVDSLVEAACRAGSLGAKLSGAGCGGNVIALVNSATRDAVTTALLTAGAVRIIYARIRADKATDGGVEDA